MSMQGNRQKTAGLDIRMTTRDLFFMLAGGGLVAGLSLVAKALIDWISEIYDAKKRNVRPFDGWKGGRL